MESNAAEKYKNIRIKCWKGQGIVSDNWEDTFREFVNTIVCNNCNVKLTGTCHGGGRRSRTTACIDHDHSNGLIREIICMSCNSKKQ